MHFEGNNNLKAGFGKIFERRIKLIAVGANAETVKGFPKSCRKNPSDPNVLLIDSESPAPSSADAIR